MCLTFMKNVLILKVNLVRPKKIAESWPEYEYTVRSNISMITQFNLTEKKDEYKTVHVSGKEDRQQANR